MKLGILCLCAAALLAAPQFDLRESLPGVWKGLLDGVPAVEMRIEATGSGAAVKGTIKFVLVRREGDTAPARAAGEHVVPIVDPRLEGRTLHFLAPRRDDKVPMSLELSPSDPRTAVLRNLESPELAVKMTWHKP